MGGGLDLRRRLEVELLMKRGEWDALDFGLGEANRAVKAPGCHQANTLEISLDGPIRMGSRYTFPKRVHRGLGWCTC